MISRKDLRRLAQERLSEAKLLFDAGRYDIAAYLCGYALELALKACICKRLRINEYPEKPAKGAFKTHDFDDLLLLAGLRDDIDINKDAQLYANWNVASEWKPDWRYQPIGERRKGEVQTMLNALNDKNRGVMSWLKKRW